jgi:hypothetical protein
MYRKILLCKGYYIDVGDKSGEKVTKGRWDVGGCPRASYKGLPKQNYKFLPGLTFITPHGPSSGLAPPYFNSSLFLLND